MNHPKSGICERIKAVYKTLTDKGYAFLRLEDYIIPWREIIWAAMYFFTAQIPILFCPILKYIKGGDVPNSMYWGFP